MNVEHRLKSPHLVLFYPQPKAPSEKSLQGAEVLDYKCLRVLEVHALVPGQRGGGVRQDCAGKQLR